MREWYYTERGGWQSRESAEWTLDQPSRGLGDMIAKVTHAIGITPCGGCKKRQATLNRLLPYGAKKR